MAQYALSGLIYDSAFGPAGGVLGARVEITTGPNAGRNATTDGAGRYRLESLTGGNFTLRVSASSFETTTRESTLVADVTLDLSIKPTAVTTSGRVVDALSLAGLGGVTINGGSVNLQTDPAGTFIVAGPPGSFPSPLALTFTSPLAIARETALRVPGKDAMVSLIPVSFDLLSFDEMFRTPKLDRWVTAPGLVIETRSGQFTEQGVYDITTIADSMSDAEYASIVSDMTIGLAALSGNTFTAFASITRQDSPQGAVVNTLQPNVITVMRLRGMNSSIGAVGLGSAWLFTDGAVFSGSVKLDRDYDQNRLGFTQQIRQHELGHAMGYSHVTRRDSVMNPTTGPRAIINDADRVGARIAFQRPPGNRTPDIDPTNVGINPLKLRATIKGPERD